MTSQIQDDPTAWMEFRQALTRPAWPVLLIVLFVNAALSIAVIAFFSSLDHDKTLLFMRNKEDDYAYSSAKAMALSKTNESRTTITWIGGSSARECLTSEQDMATKIAQHLDGTKPKVYIASGSGWNLFDTVAVAGQVSPNYRGLVLIVTNPNQLCPDAAFFEDAFLNSRLGFTSEAQDEEARKAGFRVPFRTGNQLLDKFEFFFRRIRAFKENLVSGPPKYNFHRYHNRPRKPPAEWDEHAGKVLERLESYPDRIDTNLEVLSRTIKRLESNGSTKVIIVESMVSPRFVREFAGETFFADHHKRMRDFCQRNQVPYWILNDISLPDESEFFDWGHVRTAEAQERISSALAKLVANQIGQDNSETDK